MLITTDPMLSPYTTTITNEARCRGIAVHVVDASVPIFELRHGSTTIRCYRSLTDRVGAVTFHLTQNKYLAGCFLSTGRRWLSFTYLGQT